VVTQLFAKFKTKTMVLSHRPKIEPAVPVAQVRHIKSFKHTYIQSPVAIYR
jgi:hypothetical protein